MDLDDHLVELLMDFVYQLLCSGDLIMGKALRIKLLEKYLAKLQYQTERSVNGALASQNIYTRYKFGKVKLIFSIKIPDEMTFSAGNIHCWISNPSTSPNKWRCWTRSYSSTWKYPKCSFGPKNKTKRRVQIWPDSPNTLIKCLSGENFCSKSQAWDLEKFFWVGPHYF